MASRKREKRLEKQKAKLSLKELEPKTENQHDYIVSICENDVALCSGPAGSGKSYIAAGYAAHSLHGGMFEKIIVTRPLVSAGQDIGSLPGELNEKIAPYLLPMQENIKGFMGRANYGQYANSSQIQYEPLELLRGRTFDYSIMILDEAQNTSLEQIKMFISRMGRDSKVIINGDPNQSDIHCSGFADVMDKLEGCHGVGISRLDISDIQRNGVIGRILNRLESR